MIRKATSTRSHARNPGAASTVAAPDHYAQLYQQFRWHVPEFFNIAQACCTRWAEAPDATKRIAIHAYSTPGSSRFYSYQQLQSAAHLLTERLRARGVAQGDRVAIVLPQRFETAVAYMAVLQMGAVAVPLSQLFGPEALEYRLQDSGAVLAIVDAATIAGVANVRAQCPELRCVLSVERAKNADECWVFEENKPIAGVNASQNAIKTRAYDAAVLIYTSGTTGPPKGALIAHRALIGNLTGFICSQNWFGFSTAPKEHANQPPSPGWGRAGEGGSVKPRATPSGQDQNTSVFWSPADWAWTGGLMDALLPSLYFGRPIVAYNGRFSADLAFELMQNCGVTHSFLFPTALKAMMKAHPKPRQKFQLKLQALMSAGEAVGDAVFAYCQSELGVTVNEMFGQTEINYIVGNCSMSAAGPPQGAKAPAGGSGDAQAQSVGAKTFAAGPPQGAKAPSGGSGDAQAQSVGAFHGWPAKPNSMGRAYPGHRVAVIDDAGNELPRGQVGDVAVNRFDIHGQPDPVFFLGYWKKEQATQAKYTGDWCRTGDLATMDADGYLWYQGRADDVFKAAGYRIGPSEVENCLVKHPAVQNAAVVPKPDAERGALVKAYVVIAPDFVAKYAQNTLARGEFEQKLRQELQNHVKGRLAPYEYPKEIEFIDALPMTTTGKVQRRVLRLQEEERAKLKGT
jgi:acetyl-CoA synthetase